MKRLKPAPPNTGPRLQTQSPRSIGPVGLGDDDCASNSADDRDVGTDQGRLLLVDSALAAVRVTVLEVLKG